MARMSILVLIIICWVLTLVKTETTPLLNITKEENSDRRVYNELVELWRNFPLLMLENVTNLSTECSQAYKSFLEKLNQNDLNAVKMLDANPKIPSGLLYGNLDQYGNFDECLEVEEAQYCLAEINLDYIWNNRFFARYKNQIHSYFPFRNTIRDPGHRVPGFSLTRWGFCIPRECSSKDLENSLKENFGVESIVREGMCQKAVSDVAYLSFGDVFGRTFFAIIVLAIVGSTLLHNVLATNNSKVRFGESFLGGLQNKLAVRVLMSFSLQKNIKKLLTIEENRNEIAGIHGLRAVNAVALYLSHKSIALFFNPYINRTLMVQNYSKGWTIIAKNAIVYTDSFLLISGLLNANALLNDMYNGKSMQFKKKLISRLFRIIPNLFALILFCTYILPNLGSGPLWPTVVTHHSELCKKNMWRNLLFVQNYFGFENLCLSHTHQIGIDMQLFIITPIIIYLLWLNKKLGFMLVVSLASISTILRFWVTWNNNLSSVVYFGISVSKMFNMANLSYTLPTHRATIYLIGVYLAYILKFSSKTTTKSQRIISWIMFLTFLLSAWLGPYSMAQRDYVYNRLQATVIATFYPILWGIGLALAIFGMNRNFSGWPGRISSWKYFEYFTKISYSFYLIQFPVFFYQVGQTRTALEYSSYMLFSLMDFAVVILLSTTITLFIEMPFQNIKTIIFNEEKPSYAEEPMKKVKEFGRKAKSG